jgi:hypothetical protein
MTGKEKHIITTFTGSLLRLAKTFMVKGILFAIVLIATGNAMAQTQVEIPNPDWELDSVIYSTVHQFTVPGDENYDEPSDFVWNVDGGRLFFDSLLTEPSPAVTSDTVKGNDDNITSMWVVWDSFDTPLDTGYVYVYEISADGCELPNDRQDKYSGMRIKVSAPPDVKFVERNSQTCSYMDGINVPVYIDGMPPFKLTYKINDVEQAPLYISEDDLDENVSGDSSFVYILIDDFVGKNENLNFEYDIEITEVSSGGIEGERLQPYHTVYAYRRPEPTAIRPDWLQITEGEMHTVYLDTLGESPDKYFWDIYRVDNNELVYYEESIGAEPYKDITFNFEPGSYYILSQYVSENGCMSLPDTLEIEIFGAPVISFTGDNYNLCSESSLTENDVVDFEVEYWGALTYGFTYAIYDYNNNEVFRDVIENITLNKFVFQVENTFINDAVPQVDRNWRIVILSNTAENEEGVGITVEDGERIITIHPKPIVHEDIDFAN